MNTTPTQNKRLHAWDYKEFRERYCFHAPDTTDATDQDMWIRMWEPTGARGYEKGNETGTHFYAHMFFPRAIKKMMTEQRLEYLSLLDDQSIPLLNVMAHRTFGKTVLGAIFCCRQTTMRFSRFLLYTSSEQKIAIKRTEYIRAALVGQQLRAVFGDMQPRRNTSLTASFSEDAFFLVDPKTKLPFSCISPRGSGQAVNGSVAPLGVGELARVDFIFNDDGQPRKHIENPDVRENYEQWIEAELLQTVETDEQPEFSGGKLRWLNLPPTQKAPWRAVFGDSYKHVNAYSVKKLDDKNWDSRRWALAEMVSEGKYRSLHATMNDFQVQALYERFKHKPDYFAREYLCRAGDPGNKAYLRSMFRHKTDADVRRLRGLRRFGVMDPARVGHTKANKTSLLVVGVDERKGDFYLRKNIVKNMDPPEYYQELFNLARETGTRKWWIEDDGLNAVVRNAIEQAANLAGMADEIELDWLQSRRSPGVEYGTGQHAIKEARAGVMQPYYKQGRVYHDESMEDGPLEQALLQFPDCEHWDATDTLGYIPEILEKEEIYFDNAEGGGFIDDGESEDYEQCARFMESLRWCR